MAKYLIAYVVSAGIISGACIYFLPGELTKFLEQRLSQNLDAKVAIESLEIQWKPFIGVTLKNVTVVSKASNYNLKLDRVTLSVNMKGSWLELKSLNLKVAAQLDHPTLVVHQVRDLADGRLFEPTAPSSVFVLPDLPTLFASTPIRQLSVDVGVDNGEIQIFKTKGHDEEKTLTLKSINLKVSLPKLNDYLHVDAQLLANWIHAPTNDDLPFKLSTQWSLKDGVIGLEIGQMSLIGLQLKIMGQYVMKDGRHFWKAFGAYDDLSLVPISQESKLPITSWEGKFNTTVVARKTSFVDTWLIDGNANLTSFLARLDYQENENSLKGRVKVSLDSSFRYQKKLEVPQIKFTADLTDLQILAKDKFKKASGDTLSFTTDAFYTKEKLQIHQILLQLASLKSILDGNVESEGLAHLRFFISPSALNGFEKFFPIFEGQPMTGNLSVLGNMSGDLLNTADWILSLDQFRLNQFQGSVNFKDESRKIDVKGPIRGQISLQMKSEKNEIKNIKASANLDLTDTSIAVGNLFKKTKKGALTTSLNFKFDGPLVQVDKLQLASEVGNLELKSQWPLDPQTETVTNLILKNLDFKKAAEIMPPVANFVNEGQADLAINVKSVGAISDPAKARFRIETKADRYSSTYLSFEGLEIQGDVQNGVFTGRGDIRSVIRSPVTLDRMREIVPGNNLKTNQPLKMASNFEYKNRVLYLRDVYLTSQAHDEFRAQGWLNTDATLSFNGLFLLGSSQLGRQSYPVQIQGSLGDPKISLIPPRVPASATPSGN